MPVIPRPLAITSFAFVLCTFTAPFAALAQDLVTADNPEKILEIARGFGSAELEAQSDGTPRIRARMDGISYSVFFYGCDDGKDCTTIQFWTYAEAPPNALVAVNNWNRDRRFGKVYVDAEGDVVFEMDVNLLGGVTPKNLDDTFDWWRLVLRRADEEFQSLRDKPEAPPPDAFDKTL